MCDNVHNIMYFNVFYLEFLVAPTSVITTLNATATFICVVKTNFSVKWSINGLHDDTPALHDHGIVVHLSNRNPVTGIINTTLTVPATMENNETKIICTASGSGFVESPEVTLLIQGMNNYDDV